MKNTDQEFTAINRRFDRDAKVFDSIYNEEETGFSRWFNQNFRKPIYERFDIAFKTMGDVRNKSIIDIGCGTGIYLTNLAAKGASKVLGIDFSEQMLAITEQKAKKMGLQNNYELRCENFMNLALTEKFDYALAMGVFDYLSDPIPFMQKLRSVTNGKVIASFPSFSLIRGTLRKLRYVLTFRGNVYYYKKSDIEKIAQAAGFKNYQLMPIKTGSGFVLIASS